MASVLTSLQACVGIGLWTAFFWSLARAPLLESLLPRLTPSLRERSDLRLWVRFAELVLGLEQTLRSGWVPTEAQWAALDLGQQSPDALKRCRGALLLLRSRGVALLPALARTRELALFLSEGIRTARQRAFPVLLQSWLVAVALPVVAFALSQLLPELEPQFALWGLGCALLWVWCLFGGMWMRTLARRAVRGGLRADEAAFGLAALLGLEAFRTSLESGHPADVAWAELRASVHQVAPQLATLIPVSVFGAPAPPVAAANSATRMSTAAQALRDLLRGFHQGIYLSVMEGRPCGEHAVVSGRLLRDELQAQREREFGRLPTQLLVPLFTCGALPWLALLALALGLAGLEILGGGALG